EDSDSQNDLALNDNKIEAIFDLMGILLILLSIDAVHASNSRTATLTYFSLRMLSYFFQSLILALSIFFTYSIYKSTGDFFYVQYLITSLAFATANLLLDLINRHEPDILSSSEFVEIAIRTRTLSAVSIDQKEETITCAGKIVSVILAFIFGELMNHGILEDEYNFAVMTAVKEKLKLASICSQFIFCLIVRPSVLWIKSYLTALVIYASIDVKIRELRAEKRRNKHKVHEPPVDDEKHTEAVTNVV
ncbi:25609_t:CDS:2, partial [Dentiscutata erythropus]